MPLLQENAQSITVLEGQSVTLQCIPTPSTLAVGWRFNGDILFASEELRFSPLNMSHTINIRYSTTGDTGEYVCFLNSFQSVKRSIMLQVEKGKNCVCMCMCCVLCVCICVAAREAT